MKKFIKIISKQDPTKYKNILQWASRMQKMIYHIKDEKEKTINNPNKSLNFLRSIKQAAIDNLKELIELFLKINPELKKHIKDIFDWAVQFDSIDCVEYLFPLTGCNDELLSDFINASAKYDCINNLQFFLKEASKQPDFDLTKISTELLFFSIVYKKENLNFRSEEHKKMLIYLISLGADIYALDNDHYENNDTMLTLAATMDNEEAVEILLAEYKSRIEDESSFKNIINTKNNSGDNAVTLAIESCNPKISNLLIKNGAEIITKYENFLPGAAAIGDNNLIKELLDSGLVDVDEQNMFKDTAAIIQAAKNGHKHTVEFLIKNEANVNISDYLGNTALIVACKNGYKDIAELLLKNGANINQTNSEGSSALIEACLFNKKDIVKFLIENGAYINLITKNEKMTALLVAVQSGNLEIAELLLINGADYNAKNVDNQNASMIAYINNNDLGMVNLLIRYGAFDERSV